MAEDPKGAGAQAEYERGDPLPASSTSDATERERRIHGATGALLGGFVVWHVATQASAVRGAGAYDRIAGALSRSPALAAFELLVVVALAIHVVTAARRLGRASGAEIARYGGRRLWAAQRVGAALALGFVVVHLYGLRFARLALGLSPDALHSTLEGRLSSTWAGVPWTALFYLGGLAAVAFYFANGLFAWMQERALLAPARRRVASAAIGGALFLVGGATVMSLATGQTWGASSEGEALPCGPDAPGGPDAAR